MKRPLRDRSLFFLFFFFFFSIFFSCCLLTAIDTALHMILRLLFFYRRGSVGRTFAVTRDAVIKGPDRPC